MICNKFHNKFKKKPKNLKLKTHSFFGPIFYPALVDSVSCVHCVAFVALDKNSAIISVIRATKKNWNFLRLS